MLLSLPGISLFGETLSPFVLPSARSFGMGGNHAALADDFYALFTNPAAFVGVEKEFSAAEINLSAYGPVFEIMDMIMNGTDSLENLDLSGIIGARGFAAGVDLGGPLSVGWVGRGLGLGLFNRVKVDAVTSGAMIRPILAIDLLMVGGYSFRLVNKERHTFDAGFLGKGFLRMGLNLETSIFDIENIMDDQLDRPFTTALGLGFDLGLKYTFAEALSVALVCFDVWSPAMATTYRSYDAFKDKESPIESGHYASVNPRLNLGLAYRIRSFFLDKYISRLVLLLDYQDFLDLGSLVPRNPVLNFGLGMEVIILEKLSLRLGIADALPSAGFGLDLSFVQFDCSIHGKELGLDPGVQSTYAIDFGLLFRY
jgi:hypothetical protein